ncbi:MAG: response regulator transcription factor [Bacteroidales bacterium]|nr:response regulator transcription factor [Bacteroidales bacterium]
MSRTITFNKLREIKDQLPEGGVKEIARKLNMSEETVRNYFGGWNYDKGECIGIHLEQGPDGGLVTFDDTTILDIAEKMISAE